jgi:hypothetical protein
VRSSSGRIFASVTAVAFVLGAVATTAFAQGGQSSALSPMAVANVSCRLPANARGKPLPPAKGGAHQVQLLGTDPPRLVSVTVDSANRILEFHSRVNWPSSQGNESVDVVYKADGGVNKATRTLKPNRSAPSATTPLVSADFGDITQMTSDVLNRCRS